MDGPEAAADEPEKEPEAIAEWGWRQAEEGEPGAHNHHGHHEDDPIQPTDRHELVHHRVQPPGYNLYSKHTYLYQLSCF